MSEKQKKDNGNMYPKDARDIFSLLKQMQGALAAVEKKIDALAEQSKPRSFQGRQFSKPYKDDRFSRSNSSARSNTSRQGGRSEGTSNAGPFQSTRPFSNRSNSAGGYRGKKKPFSKRAK